MRTSDNGKINRLYASVDPPLRCTYTHCYLSFDRHIDRKQIKYLLISFSSNK